jgi:zinc transport system substrate-binding protein
VPPGSSPETYEPSPIEIEKLSNSDLYFSIGVPIEKASILSSIGNMKVVPLAVKVAAVYPDRTFGEGDRDPHIWLSPKRAKIMVQTIAEEMGKLDAKNKDTYTKNAEKYIAQLDGADKEISDTLKNVKNKKIVVYHPAFGYLADDYGIEMFALEEEGKESTPQHLQEMIDLAKKENIKVIFYQEEIDSSQSEAYAEEIGGKAMQLSPLSADYIENLNKMAKTMAEAMQ